MDEKTPAGARDLLARAEKVGAARGLRRMQRDRGREARRDSVLRSYQVLSLAAVVVYAVLVAALGWGWALGVLAVMVLLGWAVVAVVRSPDLAASITVVVLFEIAAVSLSTRFVVEETVPGSVGLLVAVLPLVALFGVHSVRRWVPRRWVYVAAGCLGAVVAVLLSTVNAALGAVVGILWVLAVVLTVAGVGTWWQVKRARWRSGVTVRAPAAAPRKGGPDLGGERMKDEWIAEGVETELQTAVHLLDLPEEWTVLHSREVPGSRADIDHLLVGPTGVYLVDSKNWSGVIKETLVMLDDPDFPDPVKVPVLDGWMDRLPERVTPTLFEAGKVAQALSIPSWAVTVVVALGERVTVPAGGTVLNLDNVEDPTTGGVRHAQVHLMAAREVPGWVASRPVVSWSRPTLTRRVVDKVLRREITGEMVAARDRQFMADLGVAADYVLRPQE